MSKQPPQEAHVGDGELPPPPYSPTEPSSSSSNRADSLFAAHLASLRGQMRAQQASRASRQDQHDTQLLALLVPHIEALLASLDEPLVQATLIPEEAMAADWTPAETEEAGFAQSVVRVRTRLAPTKMMEGANSKQLPVAANGGGSGAAEQQEFDGWGRWGEDAGRGGKEEEEDKLWWKDQDLAKRLARYLQPPKHKVVAVDRPAIGVAKVAEARKSKSRWNVFGGGGGGRKSSSEGGDGSTAPAAAASSRPDTAAAAVVEVADDVSMHVTAKEVTFRRENEMGIWESSTGWGIVVRVRVRT